MRFLAWLAFVASVLNCFPVCGAESATARIWCLSLRFQEGADSFGDTLDFSTIGSTSPNGELAPDFSGRPANSEPPYVTGFSLDVSGIPVIGTLSLQLPPVSDVNQNGFNDFFETAMGTQATTTGMYTTVLENGTISASWQRSAGAKDGICILHLVDSIYGDLGEFRHVFSLIEYNGSLSFIPGSNIVTGTLSLVQAGDPTSQFAGPIQFLKVSTNRFNQLVLQPGTWTNASAQMLSYTNELFSRELPWNTNYAGYVDFDDGDPNTGQRDYRRWVLAIDDANDANQNGIPDFSDDPSSGPAPEAPVLGLIWNTNMVQISISGTVGHVHDIQQATVLPATNWQTIASVTLTNSLQLVPIPYTSLAAAFWRVVAH